MVAIEKQNVEQELAVRESRELVRFVVVGSVDDGKSTLIGRLLYETGGLYEDQIASVRKASRQGGEIDFSLFTDGLRAEREQGITIDVAYRYFSTARRKFVIADTPGHEQYTRNMATGASTADAAVILVDARLGVLPQSRRHAYIAALLGIPHLAVAINKMDLVGFDRDTFERIRDELELFARPLGFEGVHFFPVSAAQGDNIAAASARTPWHEGGTILDFLERVPVARDDARLPFRFPVQLVLRPHLDYRGFAGRVASGRVSVGDEVLALPSGRRTRVVGIDTFEGPVQDAPAPLSVTLRLADEIDLSRGDVLVHPERAPQSGTALQATLVWLNERPLDPSRTYLLKHGTRLVSAQIARVRSRLELNTLQDLPAERLELNDIGSVELVAHRALHFDPYCENRATGRFVLIDALTNATVAAGVLERVSSERASKAHDEPSRIAAHARAGRLGHAPAAVLLADAALDQARALELELFERGFSPVVVRERAGLEVALEAGLIAIAAPRDEQARAEIRASLASAPIPWTESHERASEWLDARGVRATSR